MISYDNAPNFRYAGYRYVPDIMEDEEGIRKAWHNAYKVEDYDPNKAQLGITAPTFTISGPAYRWLTYEEFVCHIDNLREDNNWEPLRVEAMYVFERMTDMLRADGVDFEEFDSFYEELRGNIKRNGGR